MQARRRGDFAFVLRLSFTTPQVWRTDLECGVCEGHAFLVKELCMAREGRTSRITHRPKGPDAP